jgi:Protein of unknown function (DUF1236)
MKKSLLAIAALVFGALPFAVHAQGTVRGAEEGAAVGEREGGPVGAVVGGVIGAAAGTIGGILGVEDRPRFRDYVVHQHHSSFRYQGDVRIGEVLPEAGVTYYEVPAEYHVKPGHRYAVVNDRPVIVEAGTRRIVEIID